MPKLLVIQQCAAKLDSADEAGCSSRSTAWRVFVIRRPVPFEPISQPCLLLNLQLEDTSRKIYLHQLTEGCPAFTQHNARRSTNNDLTRQSMLLF
jgi:hypothetical protein